MNIVPVPGWKLGLDDGRYYGWRWCLNFGPWLIFFSKCEPVT